MTAAPLVIGVGNEWRSDDAAGLVVARRLAALEPALRVAAHGGEPVDLIDEWAEQDEVILVDAVASGAPPRHHPPHRRRGARPRGTRRPAAPRTPSAWPRRSRSAGPWGGFPGGCCCSASRAGSFDAGASLSPEVERAAETLAHELRDRLALSPRA